VYSLEASCLAGGAALGLLAVCEPEPVQDIEILPAFTADEVRAAQEPVLARVPDGALIFRAATGLAVECARLLKIRYGKVSGRRVVLLVGPGNNGGDALVAGALLGRRGVKVDGLLLSEVAYPAGLAAMRSAGGSLIEVSDPKGLEQGRLLLSSADLIIDGIVGIGGTPGLRAPADSLVRAIPPRATVVAVDLPSGVVPDTGETPTDHVRADVTVAFGGISPCLLLPPAAHAAGQLIFVDVGIGGELPSDPTVMRLTPRGVAARWPTPGHVAHKYTRGVLGVVAGSDAYPGAAVLAVSGAIRAGVGIVRYIGPPVVTTHVLMARPEAVPGTGRVQAWLLGSGVEADVEQDSAIDQALGSGLPCVVDAGALEACVRRRAEGDRPADSDAILLTPHAGELARMLQILGHEVSRPDVEARPWHHVRWLASLADATVLLKGPTTLVANPAGKVYSQNDGSSWLATAGSGDVLAGIAGALMASGVGALEAGAMAAHVHGRAAIRASAGGPIAAGDIADATPATVADLLQLPLSTGFPKTNR
jgi:hydroxyethylthiazole kinase-like uncharacterized protein yjeF